ncbi:MAG: septal ring lytic transglycosylase RlpA family protein [Desulfuromonadaceae bacterium]|nr:septal ring lytic transglycosylase RlpA family protein [Desulfuromonadaceae bacterium]
MHRILFFIVLLALTACSSPRRSELPIPKKALYETPEPTRPAPTGLKGWQKPYEVYGRRYTPLLDHDGFVQEGIASWYGDKFHGRRTSNGEVYDMYAMTAAHKTLPMGVFVKVDNLANGRSEVVRINDRGPFVEGRIIDLSYTVANNLDVVGRGTAPVRVTALGYRKTDTHGDTFFSLPQNIMQGPFGVQLGAFTLEDNAVRLRNLLRKQYTFAEIHPAVINGQRYFRVRAGKFDSLAAAEQGRTRMLDAGFGSGFVVALD